MLFSKKNHFFNADETQLTQTKLELIQLQYFCRFKRLQIAYR